MKKYTYKDSYNNRQERYQFLATNFSEYLKESILDVGCDQKYLKTLLEKEVRYVGVDIYGKPDIVVNLDEGDLPFKDKSFHTVCCLDVLEHLCNPYKIFDELMRVSRKYLIISLPNNYYLWERLRILFGSSPNKKYGLPEMPPLDRHKWFFNMNDAKRFVEYRANLSGFFIKRDFPFYRTSGVLGPLRNLFKNIGLYPNLFAMAYWVLLQRK